MKHLKILIDGLILAALTYAVSTVVADSWRWIGFLAVGLLAISWAYQHFKKL